MNQSTRPSATCASGSVYSHAGVSRRPRPRKEPLCIALLAIIALLLPALLLHGQTQSHDNHVTRNSAIINTNTITSTSTSTSASAITSDRAAVTAFADDSEKTPVQVAVLTYANGKTSQCFAPGFLTTVARHTRIVVQKEFSNATLGQSKLHQFPFVIMTGEGAFTLSDAEKTALKSYLQRGGFLLASPGCSNEPWSKSFTNLLKELFPEQPLQQLKMDHPVFHAIYDINELPGRKSGTTGHIDGLSLGGRLVVLFSPLGLNDTENAGGGCCCCGGNELKDAHRINANILAYVLTH